MSLVTMYDSVTPGVIPANPWAVAGYVDGKYAWRLVDWLKFPKAFRMEITVFGAPHVRIADCENGDMTPSQVAYWASREVAAGARPTIYCNTSTKAAVNAALARYGLRLGHGPGTVDWWQADYDNKAELIDPDSIGHQYQSTNAPLDFSVVTTEWLGLAPPPAPVPPIPPAILTYYPEDKMHVEQKVVGPFDGQGNGYFDESDEPDVNKVLNVFVVGVPNPPDAGGYAAIPHFGGREQAGIARCIGEGGSPGASYLLNVWMAD